MKKTITLILIAALLCISVFAIYDQNTYLSISIVNQDPDPAIAGDTFEIKVAIENLGGKTIQNLKLEFIPSYPFDVVPGENATKEIGTLEPYQGGDYTQIVKFNLKVDKDATAGTYPLKIKYYESGDTKGTQVALSTDVESKENAEIIYIDQTNLIPGKITPMKFTINNVGSTPLRDLTFQWENVEDVILPVGSDNTKYIKYIDIGDSSELEFNVVASASADPDLYKLDLTLKYDDPITKEPKKINTKAGVNVGGETDFDVAFSESSAADTSFSIANIGSNPAYSVSVIVPEQTSWAVTGSDSVIIGNLNKGDYTVASFSLYQRVAMGRMNNTDLNQPYRNMTNRTLPAASNNIIINIAYTDTMGQRILLEKSVKMNVQRTNISEFPTASSSFASRQRTPVQQETFFTKYRWYLVGMIFIILVIYGYTEYKKRKLKNPDYKLLKGAKSKK